MAAKDDPRISREQESREAEMREQPWIPPNALPDPSPRPGITHRYVRTASMGTPDVVNVATSFREGWQPCLGSEYPELNILSDHGSRWPDGIEVGGLLLCRAPSSQMRKRAEYFANLTKQQMQSVNDQLEAEQDPRFRTMFRRAEHGSRVSVGFGPAGRRPRA